MAEQSPTYSINLAKDYEYHHRKGYVVVKHKLEKGTHKVPSDVSHEIAKRAIAQGFATKIVKGRGAAPENK